jgi:hypothetical protein
MSRHNRERRQQRQPVPAYWDAVLATFRELLAEGAILRGRAYAVLIFHDAWCDLFARRGPCNCNPVLSVPKLVPIPEDN